MNGDSYSEYKNIDYTGSAVRREEKPIKADAKDKALAAVCFALGYIIVYALTSFHLRAVFAVFSVLYSASVLIYIYAKGSKPAGESWFWLAAYLFAALPFPFWSAAQVLQFFMFFIFGAYFTLSAADALIAGKTSSWIFKDACKSLITVPFCNLGCIFTVLNSKSKKGKGSFGKTLLYILLGLCIALPMLMIVLPLLLKADSNMQAWFSQLFRYLHFNFASFVIRASLAVFAAMIIFGLIYGSVNGRHTDHTDKKAGEKAADRRHVVPDVAMYTAVTVVCALYILFIGLQSSYFISAFANTPPASFTYSEYARQGFFDLCAVAAVNMCIMLFANLFSKTKTDSNKGLRALNAALSLLTILLITAAFGKMALYIAQYGLTMKRVLPSLFMLWMAIVFVMIIIRQFKKIKLVRPAAFCGAAIYMLICALPLQQLINSYNVAFGY